MIAGEMAEMDHDITMDVDVEEMEIVPQGHQYPFSIANTLFSSQTCSCKNSCSRKKTVKNTGCPFKNALVKCSSSCKCGTDRKACKNKTSKALTE